MALEPFCEPCEDEVVESDVDLARSLLVFDFNNSGRIRLLEWDGRIAPFNVG